MIEAAGEDEKDLAQEMAAAFLREVLPEDKFGSPKAGPGMWASVVKVMNPHSVSDLVGLIEFGNPCSLFY